MTWPTTSPMGGGVVRYARSCMLATTNNTHITASVMITVHACFVMIHPHARASVLFVSTKKFEGQGTISATTTTTTSAVALKIVKIGVLRPKGKWWVDTVLVPHVCRDPRQQLHGHALWNPYPVSTTTVLPRMVSLLLLLLLWRWRWHSYLWLWLWWRWWWWWDG
jgi:hypothetical protein